MNDENLEQALREVSAALRAVADKISVEELVNTGLALVLIKKGILDAVGIEIIRSAGISIHSDAALLAAINERVDGLHSLLDKPEHRADAPTKYDS